MRFIEIIQEVRRNPGIKSKFCVFIYRMANQYNNTNFVLRILSLPFIVINKFFNEFFLCVEIPYKTKIGKGFIIWHAHSIVINYKCVIGENFEIRQNCTCGANKLSKPINFIIGKSVSMGANSCILGDDIVIGDNVKVGAGVILMSNMNDDSYAIGSKPLIKTFIS